MESVFGELVRDGVHFRISQCYNLELSQAREGNWLFFFFLYYPSASRWMVILGKAFFTMWYMS